MHTKRNTHHSTHSYNQYSFLSVNVGIAHSNRSNISFAPKLSTDIWSRAVCVWDCVLHGMFGRNLFLSFFLIETVA
jgi:hypothetical protein